MALPQQTYSVLVVSARSKFHTSLRELLPEDRYTPLCYVSDVASARRCLLERPFDIVVISAPLPDEFGTRLALHVADGSAAGVLLLVNAEHYPDITARVSPSGVLTLQKPTTPQMILQSLQLLCGTRERLRKMEQKTASIEEKMAEIRLVNRAKWLLIERQGLSEQEAHRFIEKQAMDRCVSRRVIAQQIIDGKTPTHAQLGVSLSTVNAQTAQRYGLAVDEGAYVAAVENGSGAAEAGIQKGDIVTAFDGQAVSSASDLMLDVRSKNPGDKVKLTLNRSGETKEVEVTLGSDGNVQAAQTQQQSQSSSVFDLLLGGKESSQDKVA